MPSADAGRGGVYDLWSLDAGNRIIETDDPSYVRTIVRELLASGWLPADLSLGLPDGGVVEGAELAAWLTPSTTP